MAFTATLGTALTTVTNGDPNSLTTKTPYTLANARLYGGEVSILGNIVAAWTSQANKCLIPVKARDVAGNRDIRVFVLPTSATAITVVYWVYQAITGTWAKLSTDSLLSGGAVPTTGALSTCTNPGSDAVYIQISVMAAGTASLFYDPSNAYAV